MADVLNRASTARSGCVLAKAEIPVWRRDEEAARSYALKLTAAGMKLAFAESSAAQPAEGKERVPVVSEREYGGRMIEKAAIRRPPHQPSPSSRSSARHTVAKSPIASEFCMSIIARIS